MKTDNKMRLGNGAVIASLNDETLKRGIIAAIITELKQTASMEAYCCICNRVAWLLRIPIFATYDADSIVWEFESKRIKASIKVDNYLIREVLDAVAAAVEKREDASNIRSEILGILARELPILTFLMNKAASATEEEI